MFQLYKKQKNKIEDMWNKAKQILYNEERKKRTKARLKRNEADKLEAEADDLKKEADKL